MSRLKEIPAVIDKLQHRLTTWRAQLVGDVQQLKITSPVSATSTSSALFAQVNSGEPLPSPWRQGRSDLADAYIRIGHRWRMWLSPECRGQRLRKEESGNRQSHGPGPMSIKELARRETPEDTLHCTVSECTGNPGSAAVTFPDCNCGSVGSRRLRMINRAVIQTSSHNR
jgi:hypothetical protein